MDAHTPASDNECRWYPLVWAPRELAWTIARHIDGCASQLGGGGRPGPGDVALAMRELVPSTDIVMVSTLQRAARMARKVELKVSGVERGCMSDDEAFFARLADLAGTAKVSEAEIKAVLDFSRVVAHTQERRYAPVASYALGLAHGAADPNARVEAARRAIAAVQALSKHEEEVGDG